MACDARIYANGWALADVSSGEKFVLYLPEGRHTLGTQRAGVCAGRLFEMSLEIVSGVIVVYRITYEIHGDFVLDRAVAD